MVVVLCVALIWQNVDLRRKLAIVARRSRAIPRFAARDTVRPIAVVDLAGRAQELEFGSSRSIVAIVDPECASCSKTIADARLFRDMVLISTAALPQTRDMDRLTETAGQ